MKLDLRSKFKKFSIEGERKWLLIAGGVLLLLGLIYRFAPTDGIFSSSDNASIKKKQIVKYRELISRKEGVENKLATLKKNIDESSQAMLDGESPSLAAVSLQNIINLNAAKFNIKIKSTDVVKEKPVGKGEYYFAIPVRITFDSDAKQLKDFVLSLETDAKYLTISDLACTVSGSDARLINSVITVDGYMARQAK